MTISPLLKISFQPLNCFSEISSSMKKVIFPVVLIIGLLIGYISGRYSPKFFEKTLLAENIPDKKVIFSQPTNDNALITKAPVGTAFLFGQINNISTNNSKIMIDIGLEENENDQDNQEQAALADGTCTLDQIETDACLNNPFYIYKTGKVISVPLDNGADIEVYARDASGGMLVDKNSNIYLQKISLQKFVEEYGNKTIDSGTSYTVATKGGVIIGLKEWYTP